MADSSERNVPPAQAPGPRSKTVQVPTCEDVVARVGTAVAARRAIGLAVAISIFLRFKWVTSFQVVWDFLILVWGE